MTVVAAPAEKVYQVPPRLLSGKGLPKPHVSSFAQYKEMWEESVNQPDKFFGNVCSFYYYYSYCIDLKLFVY